MSKKQNNKNHLPKQNDKHKVHINSKINCKMSQHTRHKSLLFFDKMKNLGLFCKYSHHWLTSVK